MPVCILISPWTCCYMWALLSIHLLLHIFFVSWREKHLYLMSFTQRSLQFPQGGAIVKEKQHGLLLCETSIRNAFQQRFCTAVRPYARRCWWVLVQQSALWCHHGASQFKFTCRHFTSTFRLRRVTGLSLLNAHCILHSGLQTHHWVKNRFKRHPNLSGWRTRFSVTHMQRTVNDSTPYLSVWAAHPSDHPTISLLESHDPITLSLVNHRIDPNIPALTVLHEMLKTWL